MLPDDRLCGVAVLLIVLGAVVFCSFGGASIAFAICEHVHAARVCFRVAGIAGPLVVMTGIVMQARADKA